MITVTICVGSSCHVKGARKLITLFSGLLKEHGLEGRVELRGAFCMERCGEGINWQIDDMPVTSATTEDAARAFREKIIAPLVNRGAKAVKTSK